jgi:hypothetical protein
VIARLLAVPVLLKWKPPGLVRTLCGRRLASDSLLTLSRCLDGRRFELDSSSQMRAVSQVQVMGICGEVVCSGGHEM